MKNAKRITTVLLLVLLLVFAAVPSHLEASASGALAYSTESNSGKRGDICVTLEGTRAGSYYAGDYTYEKLEGLSPDALFDALQKLMTDTHTKKSTYDDCRNMAPLTDCEKNNGKVTLIYSSKSVSADDFGTQGWAREHIWQKSKGGDTVVSGGADLHHVRPSDSKLGNGVGDLKYGEADGGKAVTGGALAGIDFIGGYCNDLYFEPLDNVKGDIARICLYMYVRWEDGWKCSSVTKVFESIDVLLEWCALDPVDTWEMGRNEVVSAYQGNRNVFIDYPELAWLIFDREIPETLTSPSRGLYIADCDHSETEIRNAITPTCGDFGYTGDTYCKACNEKIGDGTPIDPSGDHDYFHSCDTDCSVCGHERSITHSYKSDWSSDEGGHWHPCTVCGLHDAIEAHEYSSALDETCNVCGYKRRIVTEQGATTPAQTTEKPSSSTPPAATDTTTPEITSEPDVTTVGSTESTSTEAESFDGRILAAVIISMLVGALVSGVTVCFVMKKK